MVHRLVIEVPQVRAPLLGDNLEPIQRHHSVIPNIAVRPSLNRTNPKNLSRPPDLPILSNSMAALKI